MFAIIWNCLAFGLVAGTPENTDGLGAVGAYKALANYTQLGGVLTVFGLPE